MTADTRAHPRAVVQPFAFASLPRVTRAEAAARARLRRLAADLLDAEALQDAASELIGETVRVEALGHRALEAARSAGSSDAIGVVLALPRPDGHEEAQQPSQRVLFEVEGALGIALVAKALRQKAPRVVDASRPAAAAVAGALAAVIVAILRRARMRALPSVIAAGPAADLARDLALGAPAVTTTELRISVGEDAFQARISVPDAFASGPFVSGLDPAERATREGGLTRAALLQMGDASLALPLVLLSTLASRADLDALAPGDVFLPALPPGLAACIAVREGGLVTRSAGNDSDPEPLKFREPARSDGSGSELFRAPVASGVALVAPRAERGLAADLAEGGRLVIRGHLESHPWIQEMSMPSDPTATTTLEVLEDAPVVVRVELGSVEMKVREWADLGPGDVVALGRKLGSLAILRVGGVELARGELVQVEGEYGVRIVARTNAGGDGR